MGHIHSVGHRQGLFSCRSSVPSQLAVIGSLQMPKNKQKKQTHFFHYLKQEAKTTGHFGLV